MVPSSVNVASLTYPSTLRILIHCARRTLLNPRTGPETRCDTVQNGQTNRVPCAFGIVSTITAQPARHNRYCTCGAGVSFETFTATFAAGLAARFTARRGAAFLARRVAGRAARLVDLRDVRVAAIGFAPKLQLAVYIRTANSLLAAALHDHAIARALLARLRSQRREAPRRLRMVSLHPAFTAAVRMVHRVHGHTAVGRTTSVPARASRLPVRYVFVIQIPHLAYVAHAIDAELAHFARRQLDQRKVAFLAHQLRRAARRPHHLPALSGLQFQVMNHRAGRNVLNGQRIARQNCRSRAVQYRHTDFPAHRLQDVALLAVRVMQQRNARRTIGIVFDGRDLSRDSGLLPAEIHLPVLLRVAAAAVPGGDFAVRVASAGALLRFHQRLLRRLLGDLALIEHGQKAS